MFKSITCKSYDPKTDKFIFDLEDTDFGVVEVEVEGVGLELEVEVGIIIAREYSKRNLDVSKNLALFVLWSCKKYGYAIYQVCEWQDEYCPKYIENWKDYIPGRNEWLQQLSLIE